jgi:molybdenum cofactor synthesis domain-containing protein
LPPKSPLPQTVRMLSYEEALERILARVNPLPTRSVTLSSALGRVLAEDIVSTIDLPPFDNSAMDGYAVRAADTDSAGDSSPVNLKVIEEIAAGRPPRRALVPGTAARIFTGGAVPRGADAIVPVEDTVASPSSGNVTIAVPAVAGQYLRLSGSDLRAGATVLRAGTEIRPYEISLAAAVGHGRLDVVSQPRVAVIATGNELVNPGSAKLRPGRIYNSNPYALSAQAVASGARVTGRLRATDSRHSVRRALDAAIAGGADAIVTSGGVSVGDYDMVKPAVEEGGAGEIDFWRVAIRPGKPFVFGHYEGRQLFGLPGNPVSTMVTFELFVRPALRRMSGHDLSRCSRPVVSARLLEAVRHEPGRRSFMRARTQVQDGLPTTTAFSGQGSHMILAMTLANSLLIVPEDVAGIAAGDRASVIMLDNS